MSKTKDKSFRVKGQYYIQTDRLEEKVVNGKS